MVARQVPGDVLAVIQRQFHAVIRQRAADFNLDISTLRLPLLEPPLKRKDGPEWFPVPGMYGGFNYWLEADGIKVKLVAESWCRVAGGSGQRHEIMASGTVLVAEGFV